MSHVALLIPTIDRIGGAERQVLLLARGLRRRGWRVTVVALSGSGGAAARELVADSIGFLSLAMRKGLVDPRGWWRFNHWLRRHRPDVVHAHLPHATWFARWSRLFLPGLIVVDTIHTSSTGTLGRRLGYRLSDWLPGAVTAVSHAAAAAYTAANMVAETHLSVVPNGIDPGAWKPDPAARIEMRSGLDLNGEFLWLAAGRLEPVKDYPTLLRAFALVADPAQLVIAGTGAQQEELQRLACNLGLAARVHFVGFQANLLRWMRAADGFVSASLWEGLPMAVLEAAACMLPAVVTDVPGNRDAVVAGETGLLAEKQNPDALASAMLRMMRRTDDARHAMGVSAQRMVQERYSLERVLDQWESLYSRLLARASASRRRQSTPQERSEPV